jgi:hypothetical protein
MVPLVESALISAAATLVGVGGTAAVAIVGFRNSRSTNQTTIDAAKAATDKTVDAVRDTNKATIDAAHADLRHTLDATREGQITDRYTKAIEQLGSDKLDVRIGGIYALERVASDSARDHPTVIAVLTDFVREHSRKEWSVSRPGPRPGIDAPQSATRPDVQAAMTVIGRRNSQYDLRGLDLSGVSLPCVDLRGANLRGAKFISANLSDANLIKADLTSANLTWADLSGAVLAGANLRDASLAAANLSNAALTSTGLSYPLLIDAGVLAGGPFTAERPVVGPVVADLSGAILSGADLSDTAFPESEPVPPGWVRVANFVRLKKADESPLDSGN